jgi:hypothetical protein
MRFESTKDIYETAVLSCVELCPRDLQETKANTVTIIAKRIVNLPKQLD